MRITRLNGHTISHGELDDAPGPRGSQEKPPALILIGAQVRSHFQAFCAEGSKLGLGLGQFASAGEAATQEAIQRGRFQTSSLEKTAQGLLPGLPIKELRGPQG
jgi:hypothetical protein